MTDPKTEARVLYPVRLKEIRMRRLPIFLFGAGCGAWLNIWPGAISPWASFIFAYVLVFIALGAVVWDRWDRQAALYDQQPNLRTWDMNPAWMHTEHDSRRIVRRFAFLPVRTFDAGWIWLRHYWLRESIYGWGFHDKHPYLKKEAVLDEGDGG